MLIKNANHRVARCVSDISYVRFLTQIFNIYNYELKIGLNLTDVTAADGDGQTVTEANFKYC